MSTSLNYAPVTQALVRLWTLALGAAAVALGTFLLLPDMLALLLWDLASDFMIHHHTLWPRMAWNVLLVLNALATLVILTGVLGLMAALPPKPGPTSWKRWVCFAGAVMLPLARATPLLVQLLRPVRAISLSSFLLGGVDCVSSLLELGLLISAAIFLRTAGARLGRPRLGAAAGRGMTLAAGVTLLLCACHAFNLIAMQLLGITHLPYPLGFLLAGVFWQTLEVAYTLNLLWLFLLWSAIALFAALLALQKPPTRPFHPLTTGH